MANLNELLAQYGIKVSEPKADYENLPAWEAMRRASARDAQKAYNAALEQVESKLQYGSSPHLIAFAYNFLHDAIMTLWEPVRAVANSPLAREEIEEEVGQGGDIVDLVEKLSTRKTGKSQEKTAKELRETFKKAFSTPDNLMKELVKYSQETGKSYDDILSTPEDSLQVVKRAFGSLQEYEKILHKGFETWSDFTKKLEQLEKLPLGIVLPILVQKKLNLPEDVDLKRDLGVNINGLSGIAESYLKDIATFGKAFIAEICRISLEELENYKRLESAAQTEKAQKPAQKKEKPSKKVKINELLDN